MVRTFSLCFVLATGVAASAAQPQKITQSIRTAGDGTTKVESRVVDSSATTIQTIDSTGRTTVESWLPEKRILIEISARPTLDRASRGSLADIAQQQQQLARDLADIDDRLGTAIPSRITRQFQTLFSGVAATVDAAAIEEIRKLPNVVAVHEDAEMHVNLNESVPLIGATSVANTYGVNGAGIKVAVIDTGIDYTHPDLGGCFGAACKVIGGWDFVNNDNDPRDDHGHGTHVAGIIAANGVLKGVAPGAKLLAYKVLDVNGYGSSSNIIAALERAMTDNARIANLSLGGSGNPNDPVSQVIDNASSVGLLSVVAAGNSGFAYQTVESPGVARTALTVGATDKSWQMAYFSSRGYVLSDGEYIMKPEVVAPGVDIKSTVPTTGGLGDPTGYKLLSGTSMATPHVAGAAALLLQWNTLLTPAQLKTRLVTSARTINADLFKRGTGGIDLVKAFGLNTMVTPAHLSFGVIGENSGIVDRTLSLQVQNTSAIPVALSFTATEPLPAGTTLQLPSPQIFAGNTTTPVSLRLLVDAAVVPEAADPLVWSTNIAITGGARTVNVPVYFFKGAVVSFSFDEAPWFVQLTSATETMRTFSNFGTSFTALVKSGLWDVTTFFNPTPVAIVVREQQNIQQSLSLQIQRAEATHEVKINAVDEAQQPLDEWSFRRSLTLTDPNRTSFTISPSNYRLSNLSSRFLIGLSGGGTDATTSRVYTSFWSGTGISSDVLLPTNAPFRRLTVAATKPPGTASFALGAAAGFAIKMPFGVMSFVGGAGSPQTLEWNWSIQKSGGSPLLPILLSELYASDATSFTSVLEGAYLNPQDAVNLRVGQSPYFELLDPSYEPEAILGANVQRWNLDTAPNSLPLQFANSSTLVAAFSSTMGASWVTHTVSKIRTVANVEPQFDLYRNGSFIGTYPVSHLMYGIPSAPAPHELRASNSYSIGAVTGTTQAVITFDTSKNDPQPPFVSRFRIEQNGARTPIPFYPAATATPIVRFRVEEPTAMTVTLERRTTGTSTWSPIALTKTGSDYEGALPQQGSSDLRLIATDAAGNMFKEEWSPAIITTAAVPPTSPSLLTATRAAAASISLSWAAGTSLLGISGYRIERNPGNTIITTTGTGTTYTDNSGLVAGNAYLYRVSTIDTNNVVSTPSAYDLAALVELRDDPAVAGTTKIRGIHIVDLRRSIDAIRNAVGLAPAWTNYDAPAGIVHAATFTELRDRLNEARSVLLLPAVQFNNGIAPGAVIRASDLLKLRDGVK
jgi:subtilisin family serine protease